MDPRLWWRPSAGIGVSFSTHRSWHAVEQGIDHRSGHFHQMDHRPDQAALDAAGTGDFIGAFEQRRTETSPGHSRDTSHANIGNETGGFSREHPTNQREKTHSHIELVALQTGDGAALIRASVRTRPGHSATATKPVAAASRLCWPLQAAKKPLPNRHQWAPPAVPRMRPGSRINEFSHAKAGSSGAANANLRPLYAKSSRNPSWVQGRRTHLQTTDIDRVRHE